MMSVFGIFILELVAFRFGVFYMEKLGIDVHDTHGPGVAHVSIANSADLRMLFAERSFTGP